jgi:hypothetical protein
MKQHKKSEIYVVEDMDFNNNKRLCCGEDPRVFKHDKTRYLLDNSYNNCKLINLDDINKIYKIPLKGKNFVFLSENKDLFLVEWLFPLTVYKVELECISSSMTLTLIHKESTKYTNHKFRGGTNTLLISPNIWLALGHITQSPSKHHPFVYTIHKTGNKFGIKQKEINVQRTSKNNIFDPCSLYEENDVLYVTSAETQYPWVSSQPTKSNVYILSQVEDMYNSTDVNNTFPIDS